MSGLENMVLAASGGGGGGNFLVTPGAGLMIWTLIAFGVTVLLLKKLAYPRISEALDRRRIAIAAGLDYRGQHADRALLIEAKPLQSRLGDENGRRRAIGDGRAHRQRQRIGDRRRAQHLVHRIGVAEL